MAMIRKLAVLAAAVASSPAMASQHALSSVFATIKPPAAHRLDSARALERLAESNPGHYRRAVEVLRVVSRETCETALKLVPVQAQAADLRCNPGLLLTSYPAKREVTFRLDDSLYAARVIMVPAERLTRVPHDGASPGHE
jgi:hypothetical protein